MQSTSDMNAETYVVDTHALVWFIAEDQRLPERVKQIFERAEDAFVQVLISTIVLAEMAHIARKKRVAVSVSEVLDRIEQGEGFVVVPFDFMIFRSSLDLPDEWEIHDRIIAATAERYGSSLITNDLTLQESDLVETIW